MNYTGKNIPDGELACSEKEIEHLMVQSTIIECKKLIKESFVPEIKLIDKVKPGLKLFLLRFIKMQKARSKETNNYGVHTGIWYKKLFGVYYIFDTLFEGEECV